MPDIKVDMISTPHPALLLDLYDQHPQTQIKFCLTVLYSILEKTTLEEIDKDFLGFFQCEERDINRFDITANIDGMCETNKIALVLNVLANASSKIE